MPCSTRPLALRIALALCLSLLPLTMQAKPPRAKNADKPKGRAGRLSLVIDGQWEFLTDPEGTGETKGWDKSIADGAKETAIPALWSAGAAPRYKGVAWYWRAFDVPASWAGQTIRLRFGAGAETAQVWLNGQKLGAHADGATPFEFNVTKVTKAGQSALLAVRVEGDAKTGAGLWQGVQVVSHDEAYLADVFPQADSFGRLSAAITLLNTSEVTGDATLDARIIAVNDPKHEISKSVQNLHLTPKENLTNLLISVPRKGLTLWSPDNPRLYALQLAFRQGTDLLDTEESIFGFRSLGFADNALTLNGDPLTPVAIAPHFDLPVVLATTDDTDHARDSLRRAKNGGANIVYLAAPPPALLSLADEEGLLVIESPRAGLAPGARDSEMRELVLRDRRHPCILAWNLADADTAFAQSIRDLDPTRFLLTGLPNAVKLWAPGHSQPETAPPPRGLLPASQP